MTQIPENPAERLMLDERLAMMRKMMAAHGMSRLADLRVLDVGCGHGNDLERLVAQGASPGNMFGVDASAERVAVGRRVHPELHLECSSAASLPYEDGFFDLALMCTLMTSVLDESVATAIASEVSRVLKPGGSVLWYDFRYESPTNRATRPVKKDDVLRYFPSFETDFRTVTVLPPIMRRLGKLSLFLYPLLNVFPFLRTHYMAILTKPYTIERAA